MEPIKVGMLGFGTVGRGAWTVLRRNQEEIRRRAGRGIEIARIAVRDPAKARVALGAHDGDARAAGATDVAHVTSGTHDAARAAGAVDITRDFGAVVDDPAIGIVAEMIGGTDVARELVLRAIANGKHVVTANKALLAVHGGEIFNAARARGVMVAFEAAVAGGIPIIKALREGLTANRIQYIAGIINGTTNYILSEMRERGIDFATALKGAQALGYAEADPSFDIEGIDAAHKATIMSAIAFGVPVQFERAYVEGISALSALDIRYAEELGYRIKLLGITRRTERGIELRVHPTLIPAKRLIANVEGAMNAIVVHGDAVGTTLYYGKGAGAEPTASSVVADLVDVTRLHTADPEHRVPHLAFQPDSLTNTLILPIDEVKSSYYLRLRVADQTGVLADVARILADGGISIDALLQKESACVDGLEQGHGRARGQGETDVILLTHETLEKRIDAAIGQIQQLPTVVSALTKLRMETLD